MIEINNLTSAGIALKKISNFAEKVLKILKTKKIVSLAFVSSGEIKRLNRTYLKKNRATDVLSFPNFIQEPGGRLMIKLRIRRTPPRRGKACLRRQAGGPGKISEWHSLSTNNFLGEIVISVSQAKNQAKKERHSLEKEIKILILHGLLHLKGFDHEKLSDKIKMDRQQEKIIRILKI